MKTILYVAVIVVSAVVVVTAVGVGAFLFMNASSERGDQASLRLPPRLAEKEDTPGTTSKSASLRLSAGEHGVLEHDSGARMEIPQGALTETVTVSISEVDPPPSPVDVGKVYDFSVGDSPLLAPVTLHIPYELGSGADSSRIVPLHWDEELEVWVVLDGEVNEATQTVAVTVVDLSWFTTSGGDASTTTQPSTAGLAVQPRIVEVEVPETALVGESFDVEWVVQNAGPLDLGQVDEDAVGYVRLLSPVEIEGWRREADSGAPGVLDWMGLDWWRTGHSYSSQEWMDDPLTVTPKETGPLTVRVELVFYDGNGGVIGQDVVEHEVVVTTYRAISPTTVVVDGREYRVSGEPDSRGMIEYVVEDEADSTPVSDSLRDMAVFTAYIQQMYRSEGERSYNRAFRRFERAVDFKTYVVVPLVDDLQFGVAVSTGVGSILVSPNLFAKGKAAAHLSVDVLLKVIREFTDNAEKVTEEVALQERKWTLELLREKVEITEEVKAGRPLSFTEALRLADGDTYTSVYFPPAEEARRMIVSGNQPTPGDELKAVAGGLVDQITGSSIVTDAFKLEDALSTLKELSQPLALYEPWRVMTEGIEENMAAERVDYAEFLDSLGISDHIPFQLPVLTTFQIADSPLTDQSGESTGQGAIPPTGRIVFMSYRSGDGRAEVYVMDTDGKNVTRLTDNEIWEWGPAWSPDGQRITFWAGVDADIEIYEMDMDGTNVTQLTDNDEDDREPSWSPDGQRIAVSARRDGKWKIYLMDADGTDETRLTTNEGWVTESQPDWSPDGRRIAFVSTRDAGWGIYVINVDGSNMTRLSGDSESEDLDPSWSPDGRRIAFQSYRDGNSQIYVMDADGTNITRLTNHPNSAKYPSWSPDGQHIVFSSGRAGNDEIYVMDADGTNVTRLTYDPASDWSPTWGSAPVASNRSMPTEPEKVTTPPQDQKLVLTSISSGGGHICGLRPDGTAICWGWNGAGESIPPTGEFTSVSAGGSHTCGLRPDGTAICWGWNEEGESSPPTGEFTSVSAGSGHTCGLRRNKSVVCWGDDRYGQSTPPDDSFLSVSLGWDHTCGLRSDGSIQCWGVDEYGQSTPPDDSFLSVSAGGEHTCGLRPDGSIECWGDIANPSTLSENSFIAVSSGGGHSCGLRSDASIYCWDDSGSIPGRHGPFESMDAGGLLSCALSPEGAVACWGDSDYMAFTPPGDSFGSISVGTYHTCGVRLGGYIDCWGTNTNGQAVPSIGKFTSVSSGTAHTCGVMLDGSISCWGGRYVDYGVPPPPNVVFTSVSSGVFHTCGLKPDGSVFCWGDSEYSSEFGATNPPDGPFSVIHTGSYHTCGVKTDSSLVCWGDNRQGQSESPDGKFTTVSSGYDHTCGVMINQSIVCWGNDDHGQSTPPEGSFASVSVGRYHSCALTLVGQVECWGHNEYGQSSPPDGAFRSLSLGEYRTCGLRPDGSVVCWGRTKIDF